ncbi:MAG TPA: hypothetical protein VGG19_19070 [Tepidisphaeraceae bacterium]
MRLLLGIFLRLVIIIPAVILAGIIVHVASERVQPDENMHLDAFAFFQTHWTRPEPDSDEVYYSPMGWSRVYTGEMVYLLYGKIGAAVLHFWPDTNLTQLYRFMNVALLLVTLTALTFVRCAWFPPWLLALFLVCIPQVPYIYAYANSDAFGISASVLLFLITAKMIEIEPRKWGVSRLICFSILLLCTLLSKIDFLAAIILPLALLIFHLARTQTSLPFVFTRLIVPLLAIYIFAAWWNPQLSPWHAKWDQQMTEMKEDHAIAGRRPTGPHDRNYYMASEGVDYGQMMHLYDSMWLKRTGQSFYSRFGGWRVQHPAWIFVVAGWIGVAGLLITLAAQLVFRQNMPWETMICLLLSPGLIALSVFGSMYQSLHIDYQPQGRYLFGALVPIFFLFAGTWKIENRWWRTVHATLFGALFALSIYSLWVFGAIEPRLRDMAY